jgi:signal peptidase I
MLARMGEGRKIAIAGVVVSAAMIVAIVATYVINPFKTASEDPRARLLGFTVFRVPSRSMEPTLREGDVILVSSNALRKRDPRIGEIVVFLYPPDPAVSYVKRVVATGGMTIEMREGRLYLDGQLIEEPWLPAEPLRKTISGGSTAPLREASANSDLAPLAVPENHFFVLGDNRGNSSDSRVWGFVPREKLIGIAVED